MNRIHKAQLDEDAFQDLWVEEGNALVRVCTGDPRASRALPWADLMQRSREQARGPLFAATLREIAATAADAAAVALAQAALKKLDPPALAARHRGLAGSAA